MFPPLRSRSTINVYIFVLLLLFMFYENSLYANKKLQIIFLFCCYYYISSTLKKTNLLLVLVIYFRFFCFMRFVILLFGSFCCSKTSEIFYDCSTKINADLVYDYFYILLLNQSIWLIDRAEQKKSTMATLFALQI